MSQQGLLIFCEGDHDIAYLFKVLRKVMEFSQQSHLKLSTLPWPANDLLVQQVKQRPFDELALEMAHQFFLPEKILNKDNQWIFLFNRRGESRYDDTRTFLDKFTLLLNASTFSDNEVLENMRYLFTFDADDKGINDVKKRLSDNLPAVNSAPFFTSSWEPCEHAFAAQQDNRALYILAGEPEQGTLEDILTPIITSKPDNEKHLERAKALLSELKNWPDTIAGQSKLLKAAITTIGQKDKPGSSLNVVIQQSKLISDGALKNCTKTGRLVQFLTDFMK